jgi:fatty-acyl-CoA synthase
VGDQTTFSSILQESYNLCPERIAVTMQAANLPDQPVSYKQLIDGAAAYDQALTQYKIEPGEVVILILQHGLELIYAYFGTILHGAIPSIMPFLTEKLIPEKYRSDLTALVDVTQPSAIITYPEFETEVRAALNTGGSVKGVIVTNQVLPPNDSGFSFVGGLSRLSEDIVLLQHSSGTTGLQKGVALSHRAVVHQLVIYSKSLHLTGDDIIVSWLPLYHDMGLIAGFLMPILLRIPLILMSPFDWVRAPYKLMQAISKYRGTLVWLPNFAYNFCANKIRDRHLEGVDLSSLRAIINCSEPVRYSSHQAFLEKFNPYGFKEQALCSCYAMAENVFAVTQGGVDSPLIIDEIDRDAFQVEKIAKQATDGLPSVKMVSCGCPIEKVDVRVYSDQGVIYPERHIGELAFKSNSMLTGYYHRPDATAKAFIDGYFLTGDLGYIANGEVFVTGRKKDILIVGGKNVYPQDLEHLAMDVQGVHPGRVVAFGVFDEISGTEEVVIVAEIDSADEQEREQIGDAIRQNVTRGSAIALRNAYIVNKHWLVKTSSGKIARSANRDKYLAEMGSLK